jgi:hypothetical protein
MALSDVVLWTVAAVQVAVLLAWAGLVWLPTIRGGGTLPGRDAAVYRRVHVLVSVTDASVSQVESFLDRLRDVDYPAPLVDVHLLADAGSADDDLVAFCADPPASDDGLRIEALDVPAGRGEWILDGDVAASPFDAALTALSLPPEAVVSVLDVDDDPPAELFARAMAGLETAEVVQAGRTVADPGRGTLPAVTAGGLATWSETVYPALARGDAPFPLLRSGYFLSAGRLFSLRARHPTTPIDVAAWRAGHSLGVLDCHVAEPCPDAIGAWLDHWRTRLAAFRRRLRRVDVGARRLRRRHVAVVLAVADTPVGAPLGVAAVGLAAAAGVAVPLPVAALAAATLVGWLAWSVRRAGVLRRLGGGGPTRAGNPLAAAAVAVLWTLVLWADNSATRR